MKAAPPELVNNSAASHDAAGPILAQPVPRLSWTSPARVSRRSPTLAVAAALKAERTPPQEGSCISSPLSRRLVPIRAARTMNTDWTQQTYFAALDWAGEHHDVIVLDRQGAVQIEFRFAHTAEGWAEFTQKMQPFTGAPITLETSSGPAVDQLLQRGWAVYPVAPRAAAGYRQRKAPSGTKSDRHDTWAMADALRTDGQAWRPLRPQDQATAILRALCRDEIALIEQRTALVNQLQAALREYYPAALAAFEDWTAPYAWALILQFPTPAQLQAAGKRKWEKFLHTHRLWRPKTVADRLKIFATAPALPASAPVTSAKSLLALSLVKVLFTLQGQLDEYRRRITEEFKRHPDHDIFGSLPGAKATLGPRLLGELGNVPEEYPDPDALMCQAGVSPVSYQSGQVNKCRLRRACKRAQGHSHASALRCLGKRWLKILWRLWQNRQTYDESKYLVQLQRRNALTWNQLSTAKSCE